MGIRTDWQKNFPEVVLFAPHGSLGQFEHYEKAKGGDYEAAFDIVRDILTDEKLLELGELIEPYKKNELFIVPVVSIEQTGANKLPPAFALFLALTIGCRIADDIVHVNTVNRGGSNGFHRLACQPVFDGIIRPNRDYIIVDDTVTQGGTLASLKGYIESKGGRVVCACALTGKQYSARLAPLQETIDKLRSKYPDLEEFFREVFGYGYDKFTESEANYLIKVKGQDAISIQDKLVEERD